MWFVSLRVQRLDGAETMTDQGDLPVPSRQQKLDPGSNIKPTFVDDFVSGALQFSAARRGRRAHTVMSAGIDPQRRDSLMHEPRGEMFDQRRAVKIAAHSGQQQDGIHSRRSDIFGIGFLQ